jgi:UDP-N-acetylmuramate dehydrogenase
MKVVEQPSLRALNSFGVAARAGLLIAFDSEEDVLALPAFDPSRDLVLGGGSNLLFVTDVPGTVFHNHILGKAVVDEQDGQALVEVGAGENWHELVCWALDQGLHGLENLSLIPGNAGAAPIQNIGAYGVELASVLDGVTAWDWQRGCWVRFGLEECRLGYRDSRFRSDETDRYLLTSIRLRLSRHFQPQLEYAGLREELAAAGLRRPSAREVSEAVIRIRRRKLPDPARLGNAGSFFKNPLVAAGRAEELVARFPGLPRWPDGAGRSKLSAAWMVEDCGLKGYREGDAAVSERHALVLVNHGAASGRDIAALAATVQRRVRDRFGLLLEPEPRLLQFES